MKQNQLIESIEQEHFKQNIPAFRVGDTINVHMRIAEGEKERIQLFTGTVIARRGAGLAETIALYRFSYGAGMERVFMVHSPKIAKIEVVKTGKVRKSKLYHLRGTSGKASKVKEHMGPEAEAAVAEANEAPAGSPT
jgi:large subunit ribosomal protein L19